MLADKNCSGIGMNIETRTTGGEVAVEVGKDMIVTSTVKGTGIIVAEVGAAVLVLTGIKTVGEEEMMRNGELEADHLIVHRRLDMAPVLIEAHLRTGGLLGIDSAMNKIVVSNHLLKRMFPHEIFLLILEVHLANLMLKIDGRAAFCGDILVAL
ncbi:RNA recognition motif domain [Senna tora]|uniref:RNA recognition motif domain n=1 Tax=Senna tora TaxID=362788 RepID=A0A834U0Q9_9FABA|nr:RNA recognition motif domain [Senna tora]